MLGSLQLQVARRQILLRKIGFKEPHAILVSNLDMQHKFTLSQVPLCRECILTVSVRDLLIDVSMYCFQQVVLLGLGAKIFASPLFTCTRV